jgi:hypothetical protein
MRSNYLFKYWQKGVGVRVQLLPFDTLQLAEGYASIIDRRVDGELVCYYAPSAKQLSDELDAVIKRNGRRYHDI